MKTSKNRYYVSLDFGDTAQVVFETNKKKEAIKEAFQNAWHNWNAENRAAFTSLPNFDAAIFEEITGVKI